MYFNMGLWQTLLSFVIHSLTMRGSMDGGEQLEQLLLSFSFLCSFSHLYLMAVLAAQSHHCLFAVPSHLSSGKKVSKIVVA